VLLRGFAKMKELIYYAIFIVIFFFATKCSNPVSPVEETFNNSISGKTLHIAPNSQFTLDLKLQGSAGYSWICLINDSAIVNLTNTTTRQTAPDSLKCGAPVTETFYFSTEKEGKCDVKLYHLRKWEPVFNPSDSVKFSVIVNKRIKRIYY